MPIQFKTTLDDKDFQNGLRRMENKAGEVGKKISNSLAGGGMKTHSGGVAGGIRPYGDALDAITGQYGGVMKLNAAVHGLGLSLSTAFLGVGALMLGEQVYETTEKTRKLHFELDKISKTTFAPAYTSISELKTTMQETGKMRDEALTMAGRAPGQGLASRFGNSLMSSIVDMAGFYKDKITGTPHVNEQQAIAEQAQKMLQGQANAIGAKDLGSLSVLKLQRHGDIEDAALKKHQMDTDEKIGEYMRISLQYGVDMTRATETTLELSKLETEELRKQFQYQRLMVEQKNQSAMYASMGKYEGITEGAVQGGVNEFTKHFSRQQSINYLRNQGADIQGQLKGTFGGDGQPIAAFAERRANLQKQLQENQGKIRDLNIQGALMTPSQRIQERRDALRAQHAIDRADRKEMAKMTPEERSKFKAEKDAANKAAHKGATIDPQSIAQLAAAVRAAIEPLVMQ